MIAKAWSAIAGSALQPSGFLSACQGPGVGPAAAYTGTAPRTAPSSGSSGTVNADSPPYCVGAFLLAGSAVAQLVPALSACRPVTATAQQTGNEVGLLVDGRRGTRRSASGYPQSAPIDVGSNRLISNTMLVPYADRGYRYRIDTSTNGASFSTVVDRTANSTTGTRLDDFTPVSARYVRLTVTGLAGNATTWVSISEFGVYPAPTTVTPAGYAADAFARTVTNGLGTADVGGAWTTTGASSSLSVSGGAGHLTISKAGAGPSAFLNSVWVRDLDITVDASPSKVVTGGGTYAAVAARHVGTTDYRAKVKWAASGPVTLSLSKVVNGVQTTLKSQAITGLVPAVGDPPRIRFDLTGAGPTTLSAKVWKVGSNEPAAAQVGTTDGTSALQSAGGVGLWAHESSSATNAPVVASFDNLQATG